MILSERAVVPAPHPVLRRPECRYYLARWRTWQEEGTVSVLTAPDFWSGQDRMLTADVNRATEPTY